MPAITKDAMQSAFTAWFAENGSEYANYYGAQKAFVAGCNAITEAAATQAAEKPHAEFNAEHIAHLINRLSVANRRDGWTVKAPEYGNADVERSKQAVDTAERNLLEYVKSLLPPTATGASAQPVPRAGRNAQPDSSNFVAPSEIEAAIELPPLPKPSSRGWIYLYTQFTTYATEAVLKDRANRKEIK